MTTKTVLVLGGTGKTGSRVVKQLKELAVPVRIGSRTGSPRFEWLDDTTWDPALEGIDAAYIVQLDGGPTDTRGLVARAVASGVRKLVLLSARGVDIPGYFGESEATIKAFLDSEAAVRESGLDWTILRPGWFAQNFCEGFFNGPILTGELRLPAGDGAASYIDVEDIAAVAVAALTTDGHHGRTYELSGPRPVTIDEALTLIEAATGRKASYTALSAADFVAELAGQGVPAHVGELYAAATFPIASGQERKVSDGVRLALGREPLDFAQYVTSAAAGGAWRV